MNINTDDYYKMMKLIEVSEQAILNAKLKLEDSMLELTDVLNEQKKMVNGWIPF